MQSSLSGTRVFDPDWMNVSQLLQQHCHESVDDLLQEIAVVMRYSPNIMQSPHMQCLGSTILCMDENMVIQRIECSES